MKKRYDALQNFALMLVLLLLGAQGAWADLKKSQTGNDVCSPVVHFKFPSGWNSAYIMIGGNAVPFSKPGLTSDGWSTVDLGSSTIKANDDMYFFINGTNANDCNAGLCITRNGFGVNSQNARVEGFTCKDVKTDGGELWIQAHPDPKKEGQIYVTQAKPNVKDFYVFLPDNKTWKSATPMLSEDGRDHEMYVDNDHCGWYFRRYIDEKLPSSVTIHRDDDTEGKESIGMGGEKALVEESPVEAIALQSLFELFEQDPDYHDAVYFVADQAKADELTSDAAYGWYAKQPNIEGNCEYNLAAVIYDTDADLHPLFSCWSDGASATNDGCQTDKSALSAIYKCIGVTTGIVESTLDAKTKKPKLTTAGKQCFVNDTYFNQLFSYTKGVNEMSCYDMTFTRSKDGKWEFDSDYFTSPGLTNKVQGGFYPVEDTDDAKIIATLLPDGSTQTPAPKARTKRFAQGPVFYGPLLRENDPTEQIPKIDVYCNGPGWTRGHDCEGLFADGDATTEAISTGLRLGTNACVFGWSCNDRGSAPDDWPFYADGSETSGTATGRWESQEGGRGNGGRNQHFCFESHANFRFKKGLKFNFRGDDDIWVYIDNKLAVDLGGTHLAAPGYVDLDKFMPNAEVGNTYDIDIYFCDRRTTMSNVRIKTNMFIEQTTGIEYIGKQDKDAYKRDGTNVYKLCYKESGGGSCAAALGGEANKNCCGSEIVSVCKKSVSYMLTQDKTGQDPSKTKYSEQEFAANPKPFNGAIDVSDPTKPIIHEDDLADVLPSGKYYLIIKIGNETSNIEISIKGAVGLADREAITVDGTTGAKSLPTTFVSQKMASTLNPSGTESDDKQLVPLYIGEILDPCSDPKNCHEPIELHQAANELYSLESSNKDLVFFEKKDGKFVKFSPGAQRRINETGIDTVYVTLQMGDLGSTEETVTVNVKGTSRKAKIIFYAPKLIFVDSDSTFKQVTGDPITYIRDKGSSYDFYVVALMGDNSPCTECNFELALGSLNSSGLKLIGNPAIVNGRAKVTITSSLEYLKGGDLGEAKLQVIGPNEDLTMATYTPLQFREPPVPYPLFADIFDIYGEKPATTMNILSEYFSMDQEYLDGIGDSLVIYYNRMFHVDSLPDKIVVMWEDDKDSITFEKDAIKKGSTCGAAAGVGEKECKPYISISGRDVKLSKKVKTSGIGALKSWATYCPKHKEDGSCAVQAATAEYSSSIYDRIAPIILSARAVTDSSGKEGRSRLKVIFSEPVAKSTKGESEGDNLFNFQINSGKSPQFADYIPLSGISLGNVMGDTVTLLYSQKALFPQSGDYIHIRSVDGIGLITDQSDYLNAQGADTLRVDAAAGWNIATGYKQTDRLPSPWVLISGDVTAYAERILSEAVGGIPPTMSQSDIEKLPATEVIAFDASMDQGDFHNAIFNKSSNLDSAFAKYGYVPHGWYVKTDMGALIESKEEYAGLDKSKVFFDYELQFFTNLGSHVLTQKGRINCTDSYFNGDCVQNRKNFFIVWNMKSDKNRLVGSGAYIAKLKSFVQLDKYGKKNKNDKTEMWGVRHNAKVVGSGILKANK